MADKVNETNDTWLNKEFLEGVLEKEEGQPVIVETMDVTKPLGKGENYVSVLHRVTAKYHPRSHVTEENKSKTISLMVKSMSHSKAIKQFATETGVFPRETKMYRETLPRLHSSLDSVFEPGTIRLGAKIFPCDREDTIVLEDLQESGFKLANRQAGFDLEHSLLVVKKLALLHATSVALHASDPEHVESYRDPMYGRDGHQGMDATFECLLKNLAGVVEGWGGDFETYAEGLRKRGPGCGALLKKVLNRKEGGFNVLGHGDCWSNNVMFKYAEGGGGPIDMRFVDYQVVRYASPVVDLNYFAYSSVRGQVREQHWDRILREYVFELAGTLSVLGVADRIPSLEQMKQEFDAHAGYGLLCACSIMGVALADTEDALEVEDIEEGAFGKGDASFQDKAMRGARYQEALKRLLPHFAEKGVL